MASPIPKSNQYQVGGIHYKAQYQHWDWVEDIGLGYLEGSSSAYVLRWRSKGGIEDLKKAVHYVEKLIEIKRHNRAFHIGEPASSPKTKRAFELTDKMCDQVNLPTMERVIMHAFADWEDHVDLRRLKSLIESLIEINEGHPKIEAREEEEDGSRHADLTDGEIGK